MINRVKNQSQLALLRNVWLFLFNKMENKQTAVEWLVMQLEGEESLVARIVGLKEYNQVVKQAKQMEKEQHSETWKRGSYSLLEHGSGEDFERYYKETYGSI